MPRMDVVMEAPMRMESRPVSRFAGQWVHFIGIGGCGMSGLARILLDAGAVVTGSELNGSAVVDELVRRGARVSRQDGSLLAEELDLVVRTAAVPDDNAEYQRAMTIGKNPIKYAEMLGRVMGERYGIAVSGTHGKTTTTSMASFALVECGLEPSFVIGGSVEQLGGSSRSGLGPAFVVEACEFDRSFHHLHPNVAVITNIDADHLDFYQNGIEEIIESFRVFAGLVPPGGRIIANGQDYNTLRALHGVRARVETVGFDEINDFTWTVVPAGIENGCRTGRVYRLGRPVADLRLSVPGKHNLFNATAAIAAAHAAGLDPRDAAAAIGRFRGADRRMKRIGQYNGATLVDDYGHHPTEIQTTLAALREKYAPTRLICVFQPHQHSRTRHLLEDFGVSFADADLTLLPDIYAARDSEADRRAVSSTDLVNRIRAAGKQALHLPGLAQIVEYLKEQTRPGDLVVTMGAGNVGEVGSALLRG